MIWIHEVFLNFFFKEKDWNECGVFFRKKNRFWILVSKKYSFTYMIAWRKTWQNFSYILFLSQMSSHVLENKYMWLIYIPRYLTKDTMAILSSSSFYPHLSKFLYFFKKFWGSYSICLSFLKIWFCLLQQFRSYKLLFRFPYFLFSWLTTTLIQIVSVPPWFQ